MLNITSLKTSVGDFQLGPINLSIDEEVVAILGPSGCGKTTLLSVIAGIRTADTGSVDIDGTDLSLCPIEKRNTVIMFQDGALFPHMSARENIAYAADSPDLVERFVKLLDIGDVLDRRPTTLSGGERRRVALARSLAADPAVLLLDEPLAQLDAPIRDRLRTEIRTVLMDISIPVIYVTHDRHEATIVGDRIAVMNEGSIHQVESPKSVFMRPASPFVASFTGNDNLFRARVVDYDEGNTVLDWDGHTVVADNRTHSIDDEVWFSVRPEYVTINDRREDERNKYSGRVIDHVFKGETYRISVEVEGDTSQSTVVATLTPPMYDRLLSEDREAVTVTFSQSAVHVLVSGKSGDSHVQ